MSEGSVWHVVVAKDVGSVTVAADRVFHTESGALLFFTLLSDGTEVQTATFAPGSWSMHFNPNNEDTKVALLEHLKYVRPTSDAD